MTYMKSSYIITFLHLMSAPLALFGARVAPLPPPSPYADTESVTNVAFNAGVTGDNDSGLSGENLVKFRLAFGGGFWYYCAHD